MVFGFFTNISSEDIKKWSAEKNTPKLLKALAYKDHYVRFLAAQALGKMGDESSVDSLIKCLQDDSIGVVKAAILALGKIGSKKSISEIKKFLDSKDVSVIHCIIKAMKLLKWEPETEEDKIKYYSFLLYDDDDDVILQAIENLAKIKTLEASQSLIRVIPDYPLKLQKLILITLGNFNNNKTIYYLNQSLKSENKEIRLSALLSLKNILSTDSIKPIQELLDDSSHTIRTTAAATLQLMKWVPSDNFEKSLYCLALDQYSKVLEFGEEGIKAIRQFLDHLYHEEQLLRNTQYESQTEKLEALKKCSDSIKKLLFVIDKDYQNMRSRDLARYITLRPDMYKEIGLKINQTGGVEFMAKTFKKLRKIVSPKQLQQVNLSWDTIGEWMARRKD